MGILQFLGLMPDNTPLRTKAEQQSVDQACAKLQIYQFAGCPFCFRVNRAISFLQLNIQRHDTIQHLDKAHELEHHGGSGQVPCLRIEHSKRNIQWMYESGDIVTYLQSQFTPNDN